MFLVFKRAGNRIRNMSPSTIRELIVIAVILIISILLSVPKFKEDSEKLRVWNEAQRNVEITEQVQ